MSLKKGFGLKGATAEAIVAWNHERLLGWKHGNPLPPSVYRLRRSAARIRRFPDRASFRHQRVLQLRHRRCENSAVLYSKPKRDIAVGKSKVVIHYC